jgi:iron complex outermembrane receptor protein
MIKLSPLAGAVLAGSCALRAFAADGTDNTPPRDGDPAAMSSDAPAKSDAPKKRYPQQKATEPANQVTITSERLTDTEIRQRSTAAKLVFGREELDREGDSTIGEILKRLPGVTISGTPGRGGDIRMRGLGNGYTQILINGERPPRGFSMDSLSPDQVERIEIYRAPVAEFSTQAIAGTINIVLREDFKMKQTQINVSDGVEQGRHAPNVSITMPGEVGALSYLLSGSVFENRQRTQTLTENVGEDADGVPDLHQDITSDGVRTTRGIHLTPRFTYRFGPTDSLTIQQFLMHSEGESHNAGLLTQTLGDAPYSTSETVSSSDTTVARTFGTWTHRFANHSKVDVKFSFGAGHGSSDSISHRYDASGAPIDTFVDTSSNRDSGAGTSGKFSTPTVDGHAFAFGWDTEWRTSTQNRISLDNGVPEFDGSGVDLSARTRRLAAYAQDEWDISKQWSAYFGLRWEGIRTSSTTATGEVDNASSVWSPVLHGVWRIPGHEKDQLRMSLTHSYRSPQLSDLIALPAISHLNSPTSPDKIGNPNLRPELARGIDFAYEHYLPAGGLFSANVFMRNITDLMRREITLVNGRWVSQPFNIGDARTSGVELEAKFRLADFFADAPAIDLRSNYSRFFSSVEGVPGPNNRLDQQPKQTANFGIDYRMKGVPLTLGGNLNWTPAFVVQTSENQAVSTAIKRQLDLYGLWKFSPNTQLRVSANNLVNSNYITGNAVTVGNGGETTTVTARTYTTWTVKLEMKI